MVTVNLKLLFFRATYLTFNGRTAKFRGEREKKKTGS
jgi:hypothetical protein